MIRMQNSILNTNHVVLALGRCILRPFRGIFIFILVSVYMVVVRVFTLSTYGPHQLHSEVVCFVVISSPAPRKRLTPLMAN